MTEATQEGSAQESQGTEVVKSEPIGGVAAKDTKPAHELVARLSTKASVQAETGDRNELMMSALTDIATASSEAELFEANEGAGTPSLRDNPHLVGIPLNVYEVGYVQSSDEYVESGLGTFIIVHALTDRGDELVFNTGAPNVVATLAKAEEMGLISVEKPWRIAIGAKKTANGTLFKIVQPKI